VERGASALPGSHPQRGPCSATPARYALGILEQIGVELPPLWGVLQDYVSSRRHERHEGTRRSAKKKM